MVEQTPSLAQLGEVARSVRSGWTAAFVRADWPALAALYTPETAFYGSTPALHTSRDGVLAYFQGLPPGFTDARYAAPHILPLGPGLFAASGETVFVIVVDGQEQERPFWMTQVFRHTQDGWRIALHHASPKAA